MKVFIIITLAWYGAIEIKQWFFDRPHDAFTISLGYFLRIIFTIISIVFMVVVINHE